MRAVILTERHFRRQASFHSDLPTRRSSFANAIRGFPGTSRLIPIRGLIKGRVKVGLGNCFVSVLQLIIVVPPDVFRLEVNSRRRFLFFCFFCKISRGTLYTFYVLGVIRFVFKVCVCEGVGVQFLALCRGGTVLNERE